METYHGYVEEPEDAVTLFEACRLGILPFLKHRLSVKGRQSIRPGSIFVWDEQTAKMMKWTDGKSWSASRVSGSFLIYRELEGKRGRCVSTNQRGYDNAPYSGRSSDGDQHYRESKGQRYKADGLVRLSLKVTTSTGKRLHLVSYYSRNVHDQAQLTRPTNDSSLRGIILPKDVYPRLKIGTTRNSLATTRAPMQQPPYVSPYPPVDPQQYPPSASHPDPATLCYAETPNHEKCELRPAPWTEDHTTDPFPNDWDPTLPGAQEIFDEQYLESVIQSATGDGWQDSYGYQVAPSDLGLSLDGTPGFFHNWDIF